MRLSFGSQLVMTGRLFLWSTGREEWVSCRPDEITWLDRTTLSDNEDLTLHRAPRCAGLRYVQHRWELFSRDMTHQVYLAPDPAGAPASAQAPLSAEAVKRTARHVLPAVPESFEARPLVLEPGLWVVSVAAWVLRLRLDMPAGARADADEPAGDQQAVTVANTVTRRGTAAGTTRKDAVPRVRGYFERNATARLAMAYYYQEFILGVSPPQTVPMLDVVIALNLSGEGAVSDYKKLLQGFIWSERGHARDLTGFLLTNGLLTVADLDEARLAAQQNERDGVCDTARQRLRYRPKSKPQSEPDSKPQGT
jgi:hypothetical protein